MSEKVQHILLNLEAQPPPDTWEKIASRLESEFDTAESEISRKILDIEISPPENRMDLLFEALDNSPGIISQPAKAKILRWNLRRLAVAAMVTAVVSISAYYIFFGTRGPAKNNPTTLSRQATEPHTSSVVTIPEKASPSKTNTNKAVEEDLAAIPPKTKAKPSGRSSHTRYHGVSVPVSYAATSVIANKYPEARIRVSAPPIRDKKGKLILDRNLLTSGPDGYIFVTGPNGMKTKLSRKFIDLLSYFNQAIPSNTGEREAVKWEQKFDEWRNLLLHQPAFMPAGGNYLDILELKDLIQNNNY